MPINTETKTRVMRDTVRTLVITALVAWASLLGVNAGADNGVEVSDQEIRDMLRWGIEHNRTPEDILQDISGLNQARGGSGRVPLPTDLESVETPAGRVTMTQAEAERYRQNVSREEWLRETAEFHKDALKTLEKESGKWAGLAQLAEWRAAAAYTALQEAYGDLQADLLLLRAKTFLVNRKPTRNDFGWAYRDYSTFDDALRAWKNRRERINTLHEERSRIQSEYLDKIKKMTDPDPKSSEGTSMLNRPNAKLNEIGEWQDYHRGIIIDMRKEISALIKERAELEKRASGTGGPPPEIPEPKTTGQPPQGEQARTETDDSEQNGETGDGTGDETGTYGGFSGNTGGDADSTGRTTGGGTSGGDGGEGDGDETSGKSVEDLLRDFGDEDDSGSGNGGTLTVGEEILLDIQRQFDDAYSAFERCQYDFHGRMNAMAGEDPDVICSDPVLASAYACLTGNLDILTGLYGDAHSTLMQASQGRRWDDMGMGADIIPEEESGVNPMDQITIILINTKYQNASDAMEQSRDQLYASAPGCDPDDLTGAEGQTAGADDGSDGSAGDGNGGWGGGDTGNPDGGSGGTTGQTGDVFYRRIGGPSIRGGQRNSTVRCIGGQLAVNMTSQLSFPDEIVPGQTYSLGIPLNWRTSGNQIESVDITLVVTFIEPTNSDLRDFTTFNNTQTIGFTFNSADISFDKPGGAITVAYGGNLDCGQEGVAQVIGTVIVQAYERVTR